MSVMNTNKAVIEPRTYLTVTEEDLCNTLYGCTPYYKSGDTSNNKYTLSYQEV